MAIYDPSPFLTSTDKRLLYLLGQLILQSEGKGDYSNYSKDVVLLTNPEADELLNLLEMFVETKRFQETEYILESLFSEENFDPGLLRDIYLRWRSFHGKSRALGTDQWDLVLSRLGVPPRHYGMAPWYRKDAVPMPLDHFLRMESKLAKAAGISPRVRDLIMSYVRQQLAYVDAVRKSEKPINKGQISKKPKKVIESLRRDKHSPVGIAPISTSKIAGTMTIVMDLSAIYTTRDWSVAGFMSAIAGAAPHSILD